MTGSLVDLSRRMYEELWNSGRYEAAGELFHPDFDPAAKIAAIRGYRAMAPDLHVQVDETIAQDGAVAARSTLTGTDTGGFGGRPPTGRAFRCWMVEVLGFRDGRIASDWVGADWLGFFVQLGAVDSPWPARAAVDDL